MGFSSLSYLRSSYFVPSVMINSLTKASLLPSDALSKGGVNMLQIP